MDHNKNYLIRDKDHLHDIIRKYGGYVFTDIKVNASLIEMMINDFLEDDKWTKNYRLMEKFGQEFYNNFSVDRFGLISKSSRMGSYSAVFDSREHDNMVVKVVRNTRNNDNKLSFDSKTLLSNELFHTYIQEFITYVVFMSLIMYIENMGLSKGLGDPNVKPESHCNTDVVDNTDVIDDIDDTDAMTGNEPMPDNQTVDNIKISQIFVRMARPIMKENVTIRKTESEGKETENKLTENKPAENKPAKNYTAEYAFGFLMKKYEFSFHELMDSWRKEISRGPKSIGETDDEIMLETLERIYRYIQIINGLKGYGIVISHRDLTGHNIMLRYNNDTLSDNSLSDCEKYPIDIGFIDFGFIGVKVMTGDGQDWTTGYFFDPKYSTDVRSCYDTIIFTIYLIMYHNAVAHRLNVLADLMEVIDYKGNKQHLKGIGYGQNDTIMQPNIWEFPYLVKQVDEELILDRIIKIIRFEKRLRILRLR